MAEVMKDRPAYVRFEKRPIEDRDASLKAGRYVAKDVIYALVTPPGSKDIIVREVETKRDAQGKITEMGWLDQLDQHAAEGRIPESWVASYRAAFDKYKKGEEVPLNGTPIKGWSPLSPAQQQNLIAMNILTVEDLAGLNQEAMGRFGMGVVELKRKAANWLDAANSIGGVVARLTAIETEFGDLKEQNVNQRKLIEKLQKENTELKKVPA